jgi:hypothetical protein
MLKRLRLLVVLGVVAVALPLGLSAAHANGGGGSYPPPPANYVSINYEAQYDTLGNTIHVGLQVRCKPGGLDIDGLPVPGQVTVDVSQAPPETATPVAVGSGLNNVVCDNRTHSVGVTIIGEGFDAGKAKAKATLYPASNPLAPVSTSSTINIEVMD